MSTQSPNIVFNNAESTNIYVNSITTHRPTHHADRLAYYVTSLTKDARTTDQTAILTTFVNT